MADRKVRKIALRQKRKSRIRKHVFGTQEKPRLTVFRSNRHLYAQLVNDSIGNTLVSVSSIKEAQVVNKTVAKSVGGLLAEQAKKQGIEKIVFDRNGYRYHGVVRELAEAVRTAGLKF